MPLDPGLRCGSSDTVASLVAAPLRRVMSATSVDSSASAVSPAASVSVGAPRRGSSV
ncbi:hypothetical protein C1Y40_03583 [Mycobacterium talmoniae]|uniref:Uncharacterized protein n=1 Tax=Mycobacterium talmoniae TaxID=1858794 RepID=A0A2S8BHV8_9MYCO|nr:hypothetical protein C1Y40_03583 [Mycobacterium talmoniae]